MKILFVLLFLAFALLLPSCTEEVPTAKFFFEFGTEKYSLHGDNLYLISGGGIQNRNWYNYYLTDGIYKGGEGSSLSDYAGATHLLFIQIGMRGTPDNFTGGDFYPVYDISNVDHLTNEKVCYISFTPDSNAYQNYYSNNDSGDTLLTLSGGFENGDRLTGSFDGTIVYQYENPNTGWVTDYLTGKLRFSAIVQDVRVP